MHEDPYDTVNSIREALRYLLTDAEGAQADLVSLHIRLAISEANTFVDKSRKRKSATAK